jgi:hypothetical protein
MKLKKVALLLAAAIATCATGSALAGTKGVTGKEVADILQNEGYKAKLETDSVGDPIIRTSMSGVNVNILFYDCKNDRCDSLQFVTGFDLEDGTTNAVINKFNSDYRYAAAYLDDENDPFLRYDFTVDHSDHAEHIISQVGTWEDVLNSFIEATGYGSEGE